MRRLLLITGIATLGLLAAPIAAAAANSPAQIVACSGFAGCLSPNPIRIAAGSTVTWTNNTTPPHTATADTGAWDTGTINSGQTSMAITFNTAGTFTYHCSIHPNMHGSIVVTAAVAATPTPTAAATTIPRATARPATTVLAQSGAGPAPVLGAVALLIGFTLLVYGRLSRKRQEAGAPGRGHR